MKQVTDFKIRPACLEDVPVILQLIHDLATYERAPDEVSATELVWIPPCRKALERESDYDMPASRETTAVIQRELFDELDHLPLGGPVTDVTTNRDNRSHAVDAGKRLRIKVAAAGEVEERIVLRDREDIGEEALPCAQEMPVQQPNTFPATDQQDEEGILSKVRRLRITFEMDGILFCLDLLVVFALGFLTAMWLFY